jgi:uncharacterized protein (DUF4415 family)
MSRPNTKTSSKTNWERVDKMTDAEIDTSDIPPLSEDFFKRAKLWKGNKTVAVTMHVDPDVLEWFEAQGNDYEKRMNAALRLYAQAHQAP